MSPRRLLNLLRSPAGALVLFLFGFALLLFLVNSRGDSSPDKSSGAPQPKPSKNQQLTQSVEREITPFRPAPTTRESTQTPAPSAVKTPNVNAELPSLSLVAETPSAEPADKPLSESFAPFGRLIPCELVITVDSSALQTPIIGLVTEDVFHHGQLVIPAGTEVHGKAQVDRVRERIASDGRWTLVWQDGDELSVSGLALDHERDANTGTWAITDGSAGLRGRLIKSDNLAELKLYAASLLSGAADVFTDKSISGFGSFTLPSLKNAPLKGAQSVMDRYAQQIFTSIERDGFYVRVPAGKQFYLYVTQTLDRDTAKIGGTTKPPAAEPKSNLP
jgi:hypothetical protein